MTEAFEGQNRAYADVINMCPDMAVWLKPSHISKQFAEIVQRNETLIKRIEAAAK